MSSIEEYLTANAEFENAKEDLNRMASLLAQFGGELGRNPEGIHFANSGVGLPADIIMSRSSKSVDANAWPTPEQIHNAINRRFQAKQNVQRKWAAVPQAMQASLVPPKF